MEKYALFHNSAVGNRYTLVVCDLHKSLCTGRVGECRRDRIVDGAALPDEVLTNFLYAYTFRDSLVYSELFDSSFTFISWDFGVSPPEPINWGRDRELRVAGRMFRFFDTIDLTWDSRTPIASDSVDNELVRVEEKLTFTLTLDGGTTIPTLIGEVNFVFVRREEDERWVIIRWEDLRI